MALLEAAGPACEAIVHSHSPERSHLQCTERSAPCAGEGHGMVWSVALLSATLALGGCQSAGLGSNHQDIAPRWCA